MDGETDDTLEALERELLTALSRRGSYVIANSEGNKQVLEGLMARGFVTLEPSIEGADPIDCYRITIAGIAFLEQIRGQKPMPKAPED